MILASAQIQIANYVNDLFYVYTLCIFAYIIMNWLFAFGLRIPYSRGSNAVLGFLRDVSEPYLRVFRRVLPPIGGLDFTPILAIIVLRIAQSVIVNAIAG